MAPKKRAPRATSKVLPSVETDGEPAPDNTETGRLQRYKSWTPTPSVPRRPPRDEEERTTVRKEYLAWARKHFGERWVELHEARESEKDHLKDPLKFYDMLEEMDRIEHEKRRDHERQKKTALGNQYIPDRFIGDPDNIGNASPPPDDIDNNDNLKRGKTWQELMAWARMHYGEAWYEQREALDREEREEQEAIDPDERKKKFLKTVKRDRILQQMELERDEWMLAEGKTWHEIMVWPAKPSNILPSAETGDDIVSSPSSSSEHSDGSGYSTYPPTPTEPRRQAMDGPRGPDHRWEWRWEQLEWDAVRSRMSEAQYERERVRIADRIRSRRKDEERDRRARAELEAIRHLQCTDPGRYERLMRHYNLRLKGMTQEQIDAMDRKEAAALERWKSMTQEQIDAMYREEAAGRKRWKNEPPVISIFNRPRTQEEIDARNRLWDAEGVGLEERLEHERIFGWRDSIFSLPPTQEEIDATYRAWDASGVSRERQIELAPIFFGSHNARPASTDGRAESGVVSQPRASTPRQTKDISRKTRSGRIAKNTAQIQSVANHGTRSRRAAPTTAEASMPDHRSKRLRRASDVLAYNSVAQVPQQTRRSRRLAREPPQFGMFAEQIVAPPLHEPPLRNPSNASMPNSLGSRNRAPPKKKSIPVKTAKPQGIMKSGQEGTNRSKRSKKPYGG